MDSLNRLPRHIKDKIIIVDNHWIWTGAIANKNRKDLKGRVRFQGKMEYPHRVVMHILCGFVLESNYQINHLCPESLCCNPAHLYIGDQKDNIEDQIKAGHNKELNKTCCSTCGGKHSISPTTGHRYCMKCKNKRRKKWRKNNDPSN